MKALHVSGYSRTGSSLLVWIIRSHPEIATVTSEHSVFSKLQDLVKHYYTDESMEAQERFVGKVILAFKFGSKRVLEEPDLDYSEVENWWGAPDLEALVRRSSNSAFRRNRPLPVVTAVLNCITEVNGKAAWCDKINPRAAPRDYIGSEHHRWILSIRDPRAVLASQKVWENTNNKPSSLFLNVIKYKYYMLAQKKLAIGAGQRAKWVRYEDVVTSPKEVLEELSSFTGLRLDENILEELPNNSSYANPSNSEGKLRTKSLDKWKSVLAHSEVKLIETIFSREMAALGYV